MYYFTQVMFLQFFIFTVNSLFKDAPNSIIVKFNQESELKNYWLKESPLKVITHGWNHNIPDESGIFSIKKGNVILICIIRMKIN